MTDTKHPQSIRPFWLLSLGTLALAALLSYFFSFSSFSSFSSFASLLLQRSPTATPDGCRRLPTDHDWPSPSEWAAALPGITPEHCRWKCPNYRLQAHSHSDVQRAVAFARRHRLRLSVIASGHDFYARNTAASGLLLDVSQLRRVRLHERFVATRDGVPAPRGERLNADVLARPGVQAAVTFGPGFTGQQLNNVLSSAGFMAIAGVHNSVCLAGGWGQMGGVGPFTHLFGLGVDQWLEAKIVTPDGQLRVANSAVNQDLFWAIRGGGGGTFDVVVEATVKVYPQQPIGVTYWWMSSAKSGLVSHMLRRDAAMQNATRIMFAQLEPLLRQGVSGMLYGSANGLSGVANFFGKNATRQHMHAVLGPILQQMESIPGMRPFQSRSYIFDTYKEYYTATFGPEHAPYIRPRSKGLVPMGGALIDHEALTHPEVMKAFSRRYTGPGGQWAITVGSPGNTIDGAGTSVNPGWRRAVGQVMLMNSDGIQKLTKAGQYGNEAPLNQKDWKHGFWGDNYAKLSRIKDKYDPDMLLWASPGVNADKLEVRKGRVCRAGPRGRGDEVVKRSDNTAYMGLGDLVKLSQYTEMLGARPAYPEYVGLQQ